VDRTLSSIVRSTLEKRGHELLNENGDDVRWNAQKSDELNTETILRVSQEAADTLQIPS
jgi:hypothetical protein